MRMNRILVPSVTERVTGASSDTLQYVCMRSAPIMSNVPFTAQPSFISSCNVILGSPKFFGSVQFNSIYCQKTALQQSLISKAEGNTSSETILNRSQTLKGICVTLDTGIRNKQSFLMFLFFTVFLLEHQISPKILVCLLERSNPSIWHLLLI